jgi:hypothetical protein
LKIPRGIQIHKSKKSREHNGQKKRKKINMNPTKNRGVNSGAPEEKEVPAPLVL